MILRYAVEPQAAISTFTVTKKVKDEAEAIKVRDREKKKRNCYHFILYDDDNKELKRL